MTDAMNLVKAKIEETIAALFSHYNFGKTNSEKVMQFCRPAVERFIFSRVHSVLFALY